MFRHVVLLRFDESAPEGHVDAVAARLRELPEQLQVLRGYTVGLDLALAPDNAHLAVVAVFDDIDGYLVYRDHPAHRRIVDEMIVPHLLSRSAAQFRDDPAG